MNCCVCYMRATRENFKCVLSTYRLLGWPCDHLLCQNLYIWSEVEVEKSSSISHLKYALSNTIHPLELLSYYQHGTSLPSFIGLQCVQSLILDICVKVLAELPSNGFSFAFFHVLSFFCLVNTGVIQSCVLVKKSFKIVP